MDWVWIPEFFCRTRRHGSLKFRTLPFHWGCWTCLLCSDWIFIFPLGFLLCLHCNIVKRRGFPYALMSLLMRGMWSRASHCGTASWQRTQQQQNPRRLARCREDGEMPHRKPIAPGFESDWDHLFLTNSAQLCYSASDCDCCVHICPKDPSQNWKHPLVLVRLQSIQMPTAQERSFGASQRPCSL